MDPYSYCSVDTYRIKLAVDLAEERWGKDIEKLDLTKSIRFISTKKRGTRDGAVNYRAWNKDYQECLERSVSPNPRERIVAMCALQELHVRREWRGVGDRRLTYSERVRVVDEKGGGSTGNGAQPGVHQPSH